MIIIILLRDSSMYTERQFSKNKLYLASRYPHMVLQQTKHKLIPRLAMQCREYIHFCFSVNFLGGVSK